MYSTQLATVNSNVMAYSSSVYVHDEVIVRVPHLLMDGNRSRNPSQQAAVSEVLPDYLAPELRRPHRPTAVLIAAHNSHLLQQRQKLAMLGFRVVTTHSLLDGYLETIHLLASPLPIRPSIILLDVAWIQPGFPELPGSLLAAVLARHMLQREIHSAWLVGFAANREIEQETEALVAGCHRMVPASLPDEALLMLYELALRPAPVPYVGARSEQSRMIGVLHNVAARVLQAVQDAYIRIWTPEDITRVLVWLTRYPPARGRSPRSAGKLSAADTVEVTQLLRALGGPLAARERLVTIAERWQSRYPLHSEVLLKFLDGWERRDIVRHFVTHGLYEDTRVYTCIKELPQRLSEQFRIDQVGIRELKLRYACRHGVARFYRRDVWM